jgi:AraC-like DNA-binding protein
MTSSCQKLQKFVKISNWKRLEWVSHYRQEEGRHPQPIMVSAPLCRVELLTGGRGWVEDGGQWREVLPGDLIWNWPGDSTIGRSDFQNPYRCLAVTLVGRRSLPREVPRFSRWPDLEAVQAFTREAVELFHEETFDRLALLEHVVGNLLFRVRHDGHTGERKKLPLQIQAVLDRIESDPASPCRVEELAAVAECSVAHLHESFRRQLQVTPHQMVLRVRLRTACKTLASTNHPMKQIAVECGFADAAAFGNAFKAGMGLTPGAYRERSRGRG